MTDRLVPASLDARFAALDEVAALRFDALPVTAVLVYALDSVDSSALPALAWQFGALGQTWQATPDDLKRALIKRVLRRRRIRGTNLAVQDALAGAGYEALVRDGASVPVLYNGMFRHSGVVRHAPPEAWRFWVVVVGEPTADQLAAINAVVKEWQRLSQRFEVFWVESAEEFEQTTEYHAVS